MQRLQNGINKAIITAEFSHVFCCVFPTLFSVLTLLVTAGMITAVPVFMTEMHNVLHAYEIPVLVFSAIMIALGWGLHFYTKMLDCRAASCAHAPCGPVKQRTNRILTVATVVFALNIMIYAGLHLDLFGVVSEFESNGHHLSDHSGHKH